MPILQIGKAEARWPGTLPAGTANAGVRSQGSQCLHLRGCNLCEAGDQGAEKKGKDHQLDPWPITVTQFLSWNDREATSKVALWVLIVQAIT